MAIRRAFQRLLPGYEKLRVHRRGAMGQNIPRVGVEKGGKLLLFDALSEGERTLIAMVADIARRLTTHSPIVVSELLPRQIRALQGFSSIIV